MHVQAVMSARLSESSNRADELRAEARRLMIEAVADAHQAGMTQSEIAAQLGRSQPEVSRLLKLSPPRFRPKSALGRQLVSLRSAVLNAIERYGVTNTRVFGSVARGEDGPGSDVDLLVDRTDAKFSAFDQSALQLDLEKILGSPVHVVTSGSIGGRTAPSILTDLVSL